MASASSSPDRDPLDSISKDGFFTNEDAALGQRIQEMDDEAVPFASQRGLQFCKYNVLDHPRIRPVLDSSFEWSALGLYRSFGPGSEVYTFDSAPESQMEILIVMLWSKESRLFFWRGAHRHWLDPVEAANSLLQVTRARLELLGLEPEEYALKDGGFTIHDSRVAFQIEAGTAIGFAFGTKEAIETWSPMKLPKSLKSTVRDMESIRFRMNVRYIEDTEERSNIGDQTGCEKR